MGQTAEEAGALHEGVPDWMARALWKWIERRITYKPSGGHPSLRTEIVDKFDQMRRAPYPVSDAIAGAARTRGVPGAISDLRARWHSETDVIPFVDYLIAETPMPEVNTTLGPLEDLLQRNGSAWKVGTREGHPGLERRVPLGVQEAADHTMANSGRAGEQLSDAWHAVYGVNPNPTLAYTLAVRAVEDATISLVVPNQTGATLGHVIGQLKQGGWSLPLTREDPEAPTGETLIRMLKGLWKGHFDRHGGDGTAPKTVSQEEAEAAVMLAVPLVQWFTSGAAARRP